MSWSFTNTTKGDQFPDPIALGLATNYSKTVDEPDTCRLSNDTASLEQPELITFRSNPIKTVSTAIPVRNPGPIKSGVQYVVKLETVDRYTDAAGNVVDEPIAAWLTIKHSSSNNWDNAKVAAVLSRLLGACMTGQTTTGTTSEAAASKYRFEKLMRGALAPVTD